MWAGALAGLFAVVAVALWAEVGHAASSPRQAVGADLTHFVKSARVLGRAGDPARAEVGDIIEWTLSVTNRGAGAAEGVTLTDALSPRVTYVEGSLLLDGRPLSDRSDDDQGEAFDSRVAARIGLVGPSQTARLSFSTRVDAGPEVVNQAQLFAAGLPSERSDADADDANGDAPTRVTVGQAPTRALAATLGVQGAETTVIGLGDAVVVSVALGNLGTVAVEAAEVELDVPEGIEAAELFEPASVGRVVLGPRTWRWSGVSLAPGASANLSLRALVGSGPSQRCFTARFMGAGVAQGQTTPKCLDVRGALRGRSGRVFEDVDDDGRFSPDIDFTLSGVRVSAVAAGAPRAAPEVSATTDLDGAFTLQPAATGPLDLSVRSASGVLWRRARFEGSAARFDVAVIPSGRVYDAVSGRTVDGARVRVSRWVAGRLAPLEPGDLEDPSQANQVTTGGGTYRVVAVRTGEYALTVEDDSGAFTWPSTLRPALTSPPSASGVALSTVSLPSLEAQMPWTSRLDARAVPASFRRNHLPLDPRGALLVASARTLTPRVTRGHIVTLEVEVVNASARDLRYEPRTGKGGLFVRASPGRALSYVPRSASWWRVEAGRERPLGAYEPFGDTALLFGAAQGVGAAQRARPMDLPAGQALRLRWQMSTLDIAAAEVGVMTQVVGSDEQPLSSASRVVVQVVDDAVFDRGLALGRVFCDANGDGRVDAEDRGVPGALVATQSGRSTTTDMTGRFSFDALEAGGHVFKVDAEAAVPGAERTSESGVYRALTPGLPVQVELGLACALDSSSVESVDARNPTPLRVEWPPPGAVVRGGVVPVWGQAAPEAQVTLNDQVVDVDTEGRFVGAVSVSREAPAVEVTATIGGATSTLRRVYPLAEHHFFLVALAEGIGAEQEEALRATTTGAGQAVGALTLEGHAALSLRGYARGEHILGGLFRDYRFTVQVDSRRDAANEQARRLIEADRLYPIYGDDAAAAQAPGARGPLYALIEADESQWVVGDVDVALEGLGVFRYARRHAGAHLRLVRGPPETTREGSKLEAFVAQREDTYAHASVDLAATGGALYFLPHRPIVPDSAQVWVVARDRTSGVELARRRLAPGRDYTLRSAEGRLLLSRPLSTSAESGWAGLGWGGLDNGRRASFSGAIEQSLAVEYDHQDTLGQPLDALGAAGAHGRERFGDVTVGGGLVEARPGVVGAGAYRLMGGELTWRPGRASGLGLEVARSQAAGVGRFMSSDGGLSWNQSRPSTRSAVGAHHAMALHLTGAFELADVLRDAGDARADQPLWRTTLTLQRLGAGYSAAGLSTGVASDALSAASTAHLTDTQSLTARWEAARGGGVLQRRAELSHAWSSGSTTWTTRALDERAVNAALGGPLTLTTLSEEAAVRLNGRWMLHAGQAVDVRGDDRLHDSTPDLLTTSVGASMRSPAGVTLELVERVRWSGDNATEAGLRAELSDRQSAYVRQRVDHASTTRDNAFIMGGEERWGADASGRTYGEYQARSAGWGPAPGGAIGQQAVMGVGKRTSLTRGLVLDASYERSQLVGRETARRSTDALGAGLELSRGRLRATTRQEARVTDEDERFGLGDTLQVVSLNGAQWQVSTPLQLRGRVEATRTFVVETGTAESASLELALGFAWRPLESGRFTVLGQWAKRAALTPIGVNVDETFRRQDELDVVSLTPMVELPARLKLTEKVAWKRYALSDGGLPVRAARTLLWINRLDRHLTRRLDAGLEYRLLGASLAGQRLHGALVELAYAVEGKVRLGGGWNFSHFSDDDLARPDASAGGAFVRVSAVY